MNCYGFGKNIGMVYMDVMEDGMELVLLRVMLANCIMWLRLKLTMDCGKMIGIESYFVRRCGTGVGRRLRCFVGWCKVRGDWVDLVIFGEAGV